MTVSIDSPTDDRAQPIAHEDDPRFLVEVLRVITRSDGITTAGLRAALLESPGMTLLAQATLRSTPRLLQGESLRLERLRRELEIIKWLAPGKDWSIETELRTPLAEILHTPAQVARRLCIAHEQHNHRVTSRLLSRMWHLSPAQQGIIILPRFDPARTGFADDLPSLVTACWEAGLSTVKRYLDPAPPPPTTGQIITRVQRAVGRRWSAPSTPKTSMSSNLLRNNIQNILTTALFDWLFGDLIPPEDGATWQRRLSWSGLTFSAGDLLDQADRTWFPVGAFRRKEGDDFAPIPELISDGLPYCCHVPVGPDAEARFAELLYKGYLLRQRVEQVGYVALAPVRDQVCYRLRIGNDTFQTLLNNVYARAARGDLPYGLALEVDITPTERRRQAGALPILIDQIPRYIISMRTR